MSSTCRLQQAAGIAVFVLFITGCSGEGGDTDTMSPAAPEPVSIRVDGVGFSTPESVLHDEAADLYLVSNINGSPTDKDGNGFISRVASDGSLEALKWIDGEAPGVTLHAPKGMAIANGNLYVADIDCLRSFDQVSGEPTGEICVDGATFLNDVAAALDGSILFTDSGLDPSFSPSGTDAVYRLDGGEVLTVLANPDLGAPNGIVDTNDGILVVTFMSGEVFRIRPSVAPTPIAGPSEMQLDGIVVLPNDRVFMSSWGDSCVHELTASGEAQCIISDVAAPADIGADAGRNRVLIPLFNDNAVLIRTIP
jgi:hypothetical protein